MSPASAGGPILDHWTPREVPPLLTLMKGLVLYPAGHKFSIKTVGVTHQEPTRFQALQETRISK